MCKREVATLLFTALLGEKDFNEFSETQVDKTIEWAQSAFMTTGDDRCALCTDKLKAFNCFTKEKWTASKTYYCT
jgi:hypothetical protein